MSETLNKFLVGWKINTKIDKRSPCFLSKQTNIQNIEFT